mgnify:FL=1
MTGYGKSVAEYKGKRITAEIRSLNSKALDLSTRVAPIYREREMEIRAMVSRRLERGKVDFSLWVEQDEAAEAARVNLPVAQAYKNEIAEASQALGIAEPADWWPLLMRLPDVVEKAPQQELTDEEWQVAAGAVEAAVDALVQFRQQEGEALQRKFQEKLDRIGQLLSDIEPYEKSRVSKIRQRIEDGLAAIPAVEYDRGRLEQEMIYYIEKLDISEEKQRLANHLRYFRETMEEGHGQGKKLGFIAQEMGREINTTGSKSNLSEMQNLVVMMKDELEQIKEQVLNVM